jgi:O-antigen/teichoic acid export membrane protein
LAIAQQPEVKAQAFHHRVLTNIASNWMGYGINMAVSFLLSPLLVHRLGDVANGIWALSIQLGTYMGVLDFGVRVAVTRFLTQFHEKGDRRRVNEILTTGLILLGAMGLLSCLIALPLSWWMPTHMRIASSLVPSARISMFLICLSVAAGFPGALFTGALASLSRYDLINVRSSITAVIRGLVLWFLLAHGFGLVAVAIASVLLSVFGYVTEFLLANRAYNGLEVAVPRPFWGPNVTGLFHFSAYVFILGISTRLLLWSDNVVVGFILGPAAVTYYAIGGNLVDALRSVLSSITCVFVPIASSYDAKQDQEGLRRLFIRGSRLTLLFLLPGICGLFTIGKPFIGLWMGERFIATAYPVLILLAIPLLVAPLQVTCNQILYGMNRHQTYAFLAIFEAVVNLGCSIYLAHRIGFLGVALGTLIPCLPIEGIALPIYTARVLGLPVARVYWRSFIQPVLASLPCATFFWAAAHWNYVQTWAQFIVVVLAGVAIFLGCAAVILLQGEDREMVSSRMRSLRLRLRPAASV